MSSFGGSREDKPAWVRPVWVPLETYFNHHFSHMYDLEHYFVLRDSLSFTTEAPGIIALRGHVICQNHITLAVEKLLALDDRQYVSAFQYKYHAMVGDPPNAIFRYDNAHTYEREGHSDAFHKHLFDPANGSELSDSPQWIGIRNWPTLRQVLDELYDHRYEIIQRRGPLE